MASFPTSVINFGFVPAAGKALPYDVVQKQQDEIIAMETWLGAGGTASGTFVPTLVSSGGGTPVYGTQAGFWKQNPGLGLVWISFRVTLTSLGSLGTGTMTLGGLPFVSVNTVGRYGAVAFPWWGLATAATSVLGLIGPNTSAITLEIVAGAVTSPGLLTKADLSATADLIGVGAYASL